MEQTAEGIARKIAIWEDTISHHLSDHCKGTYYISSEKAKKRCGQEVDAFQRAFGVIEYPFDLSSSVLGEAFCWTVRNVVEESQSECQRPKKWELCERVIDSLEKSDDNFPELVYWPPDFNDHINRLFEREEGNGRRAN
jgi:hypothetical protein